MKNIIIGFLFIFFLFNSCKGQDKEPKIKNTENQKIIIYSSKCNGNYSTGEKLNDNDKKWSLTSSDVDKIMKLSTPITENEWHFSYPITPCNIEDENYIHKGKKIDLQINGGSYISYFDGKENIILGCDLPECSKYFIKSKETMDDDELENDISSTPSIVKKYNIDFNKNKILDLLIVRKDDSGINLEAQIDNKTFLNKNFNCDSIDIDTKPKNNQTFNLLIGYSDQYQKAFRKIVIPVFYKKNDLFIDKIFISTLGTNAKTGNEEWFNKEIKQTISLKNLDLDLVLSN